MNEEKKIEDDIEKLDEQGDKRLQLKLDEVRRIDGPVNSGMPLPVRRVVRRLPRPDGTFSEVVVTDADFVEVAPGVKVSTKLIKQATAYADDTIERREEQRRQRRDDLHAELKADLDISRQITDSLVKQKIVHEENRQACCQLLEKDIARQLDKSVQFVDVTASAPVAAAQRVLDIKDSHPEWEVTPVDLSGALDGTQPLIEATIDKVVYIIKCQNVQADLPDRVRFVVPDSNLPEEHRAHHMHTYVRLDALPKEVRSVVQTCLSLTVSSLPTEGEYDRLCDQIETLRDRSREARDHADRAKKSGHVTAPTSFWAL